MADATTRLQVVHRARAGLTAMRNTAIATQEAIERINDDRLNDTFKYLIAALRVMLADLDYAADRWARDE